MSENRAQSIRAEVQELLIKPIKDVEERRQSIVSGAKLTRQGSIVAADYDQVPKGDMVRRYREQSISLRRDSSFNAAHSEVAKVEPPRLESYLIEVPKSGVFDRCEYFTPLYLPTGCEEEKQSRLYESFEQETVEELNSESFLTSNSEQIIRNMVYCSDEVAWAEYQEAQGISSGAKTHFGLQFDSNFECGNLLKAETVQHRGAPLDALEEYDLTIRPDPAQFNKLDLPTQDSNTTCTQWFFFRVSNTKKKTYRFNIGPFSHRIPALEKGMKPVLISESAYKTHGIGWQRVGENITFREIVTASGSKREGSNRGKDKQPTYSLSFNLTIEISKDVFYLAFAPPYTYTQLQNMLFALVKDPIASKDLQVRPLCRTLAGNRCDLVTISENINTQGKNTLEVLSPGSVKYRGGGKGNWESEFQENDEEIPDFLWKIQQKMDALRRAEEEKYAETHRKKAVFVTARVHGGETVSSWMCEGLIKFLLSLHPTAVALKKVFVFYIVPMVNPDGVVNGYAKSDLLGTDLNQHWVEPSSALHPTLFHLKASMRRAQQGNGEIHAFFDLHGQAGKEGIFFHSVLSPAVRLLLNTDEDKKADQTRGAEGTSTSTQQQPNQFMLQKGDPRNFTIAVARRCPLLNLKQCSLQLNSRKNSSARVVAATEFQVSLSVAVEASFHCSPAHKSRHSKQLMSADYARFGCVIAMALADINHIGPPPSSRLLPSEKDKPTKVCRASLKAAGLAHSMVQSAQAAAAAVSASLSSTPFSPAMSAAQSVENAASVDVANERKKSLIYTASSSTGPKRDSFLIGASVPMPHAEGLVSRSRTATATDAELEGTDTAASGALSTTEEHIHFFVSEDIDPADFDDSDQQLHYDEDKWETVSDSSDADVLLPAEPGPPPVNDEGVINLTDDMLFNLRRYDELDLGIARVNPIALQAKMKLAAKPKVKVESQVVKKDDAADDSDRLPPIGDATAAESIIPNAPTDSPALRRSGNAAETADSIPGSPFTPRRPSIQSPGRNTAHSLRKSLKNTNANTERASSRGESPQARLHSATSGLADPQALELAVGTTSSRQSTADQRGHNTDTIPVRMDRLAPDVEVVRISTAEPAAKPLTPHTNKKGVVKLNFTRDMATTSAMGGLPGKQLGEPKGTVSFSVSANFAHDSRIHDLDLNEGCLTSDFDFSQAGANESLKATAQVPLRKTSFSDRTGSGKSNYPVVTVPTVPLPSDSPEPDCTPKPVRGEGSTFFPDNKADAVLLHSAEDAANENGTNLAESATNKTDVLHLKTASEDHDNAEVEAALSPFSIRLNVPVQGIDPLNNSMSPLFALYAGGAALYSERVTEMIEEQQRAKTAERLGTAAAGSRPVTTTHGSRLTTPALNTHTRATERGRPQTPPLVAESAVEGSALTEASRSKKMASIALPFVRLAPTEQSRTQSHTSSSIMFDDSLADESVNAHMSGLSLLRLAPQRFDTTRAGQIHPHHISSPARAQPSAATVGDPRTPLEKQQAQFLHDMGLEYKQIFGEQGVLSPQKKRQVSKQSPRGTLEGNNTATYNTGFPLRRAMYERDTVQLRGTADEIMPVLVHEKHKGIGKIRPVEKERVYLRHQLDQYYQHIESSLRKQQLVEEAQTEITARRIFDLVHQVSLLDAEEQSRLKLQETIQKQWLSRGGNWRGKHKYRNNNHDVSTLTEASAVPQETPESRQMAYRKLRMKLKSHGSAEESILQGYHDLIMGSEEDPGNGWQWLTGQDAEGGNMVVNKDQKGNNVTIPTASIHEGDADRTGSAESTCESRDVTPSTETPERMAFNPLLPAEGATMNHEIAVNAPTARNGPKNGAAGSRERKLRAAPVMGKHISFDGSPVQSDQPRPGEMHEAQNEEQHVQRRPPRHLSLNPQSPARTLISPPQVRISLFPSRKENNQRSTSPVARQVKNNALPVPYNDVSGGGGNGLNGSRRDRASKSPKRQLAVTLHSAPVDPRADSAAPASAPAPSLASAVDFPADAVRVSPQNVPCNEHFPEAQPHTDELQPLPGNSTNTITNTSSSQQAAELMRMDSEYANYLRYGDIYTQSILAGVDTEQLSLHGSGLVLPSANTLRENDATTNAVKFNPLLSKRLYAVASTQPNRAPQHGNTAFDSFNSSTELHGGAQLEEPTVEILARNLRQAIQTRQVELEATAPRAFLHPDKVLSPRRPASERPSPSTKAKVAFVAPPVQDEEYPVSPRLAITSSRPEGAVLLVTLPTQLKASARLSKGKRDAVSMSKN